MRAGQIKTRKPGDANKLATALGIPYLDWIPPDQYMWMQRTPGVDLLLVLWSWMIAHTMRSGFDSPFAVDEYGNAVFIQNAATELGQPLAKIYRQWRRGERIGIFRHGTRDEGCDRLFLCGSVNSPSQEVVRKSVHTFFPLPFRQLSESILLKINAFEPGKKFAVISWYLHHAKVRSTAEADALYMAREIMVEIEDKGWQQFGLSRARQEHTPKDVDKRIELSDRKLRVKEIRPEFEKLVQAIDESVQVPSEASYTPPPEVRTIGVSLLPSENYLKGTEPGSPPNSQPVINSEPSVNAPERARVPTHAPNGQPLVSGPRKTTTAKTEPARKDPPRTDWPAEDVQAVRAAVANAWGSEVEPDDPVPFELLEIAADMEAPLRALCLWIDYFGERKRIAQYVIETPNLFSHSARKGLAPWMRANRTVVEAAAYEERNEKFRRERAQREQLGRDVAQFFDLVPGWQKLLPGAEISGDVNEHVALAIEIVEALNGKSIWEFGLHVNVLLQQPNPLAKAPPRPPGSPEGPRLLALALAWAHEYGEASVRGAGR